MILDRTVMECVVDGCNWTLDLEYHVTFDLALYRPRFHRGEALNAVVSEVARRRASEVERRAREHAGSHDVRDFVCLHRLQDLLQQDCGVRSHQSG